MTSNAPDTMYSELVSSYQQTFHSFVGPCEVLVSGETVFPQERKKAFDMGKKLAER